MMKCSNFASCTITLKNDMRSKERSLGQAPCEITIRINEVKQIETLCRILSQPKHCFQVVVGGCEYVLLTVCVLFAFS